MVVGAGGPHCLLLVCWLWVRGCTVVCWCGGLLCVQGPVLQTGLPVPGGRRCPLASLVCRSQLGCVCCPVLCVALLSWLRRVESCSGWRGCSLSWAVWPPLPPLPVLLWVRRRRRGDGAVALASRLPVPCGLVVVAGRAVGPPVVGVGSAALTLLESGRCVGPWWPPPVAGHAVVSCFFGPQSSGTRMA